MIADRASLTGHRGSCPVRTGAKHPVAETCPGGRMLITMFLLRTRLVIPARSVAPEIAMIPAATTTIGSVRKIEDTWASEGISSEVQRWVRSEYRGNGTHVFGEIARAGRVKPATIFRPGKREVRSPFDAVPKAILRRLRAATAAMGAGLGTSSAGRGWAYNGPEFAEKAAKAECILDPPHRLIFPGLATTA